MVSQTDVAPGSPSTMPTDLMNGKGSIEWSDSQLNVSRASFKSPSYDESNIDFELDEAVQKALGSSMDDTASQSTESGVNEEEEDASIFSDARTEGSAKSAVQLRLESWKKPRPPTAEEFKQKLDAAEHRRKSSISFVMQRASEHFKEAKIVAQQLESKHALNSESIMEKLEKKMTEAEQRKEDHLQQITSKLQDKMGKVSENRDSKASQYDVDAKAIQEKSEMKLSQAVERKEQHIMSIVAKNQEKLEKVSANRDMKASQVEADARAIQEKSEMKLSQASERKEQHITNIVTKNQEKADKIAEISQSFSDLPVKATQEQLDEKLSLAAERKQQRLQNITNKLHEKMEKISSARSLVEQQHEAETKAIEEKASQKLNLAITKKENIRREASEKMKSKMGKISETKKSAEIHLKALGEKFAQKMAQAAAKNERPSSADWNKRLEDHRQSNYAKLESRKEQLEKKLFYAAERKQDQLDAKSAKAAAYLSATYQRGLDAMKNREESSIAGEESFIDVGVLPLTSISEIDEFDQNSQSVNEADEIDQRSRNLEESSLAGSISSSASRKSRIQVRLENWKQPTPSREMLDAKLNAASSRRKLAILDVQEKANIGSKFEKASNKMNSAHIALKQLEEKFNQKMIAATQRKEEILSNTVEKASGSRSNFDDKAQEEDEKVSAMQEKLESKLLAALERKEKIVAARAKKAGGKVSNSLERGQSALKQKDMIMERVKVQNQSKLESAKSRRKRLRELEKEKREVNMMRRLMTQKMMQDDDDVSVSSLQEKLERKLKNASERKKNYLAAKASRAADHVSSTSERGLEAMKQRESVEMSLKNESVDKLEAAAKRKANLEAEEEKKLETRRRRREYARDLARQKKAEQDMIAKWESKSFESKRLPVLDEDVEEKDEEYDEETDLNSITREEENTKEDYENLLLKPSEETYDSKKVAARNMLADEIRRANEAKKRELFRITEERKEIERREEAMKDIQRPTYLDYHNRAPSVGTMGSIDTTDLCSFDEEDVSISGLSTVKEEQSKHDRRKAQAALALAELDIKLSEIQIMQAILLAEEASLNGESEFKTCDKSVSDLNNVKVTIDVQEDGNGVKKIKKSAKNFLNYTLKSAQEAKVRATKTVAEMRKNGGVFKRTTGM